MNMCLKSRRSKKRYNLTNVPLITFIFRVLKIIRCLLNQHLKGTLKVCNTIKYSILLKNCMFRSIIACFMGFQIHLPKAEGKSLFQCSTKGHPRRGSRV